MFGSVFFFILLCEVECITSFFTLRDGITPDNLCSFILNFNKGILVFFFGKISGDLQKLFGKVFPGFEFGQN